MSNDVGSPLASVPLDSFPAPKLKPKYVKSIKTNMKAEKLAKRKVLTLKNLAKNLTITKCKKSNFTALKPLFHRLRAGVYEDIWAE